MNIRLYAANAGFFVVLSLFPMLVLLLSLLRYTGLQVQTLEAVLEGIIPTALMPTVHDLLLNTYTNTSGTVVSISALVSLWSSSRGIHGILTGLNAIYGVSEARSYLHTRLLSLLFTFLFLVVILLTLALHVFGTAIVGMIPPNATNVLNFLNDVVHLRFFLLLFVQTLLFTLVFTVFPSGKHPLSASLPGALLASIGWLVFSDLYSIYVTHFASLRNIYGSVYSVALSMLWLYCCLSILFYGGALNRYLQENGEKKR